MSLAADVMTADGQFVRASADENPDLFWALRGGGGNFGIVTRLELALHPVAEVYGGPIFYPFSEAGKILRFYRDFIVDASREQRVLFAMLVAPAAPFVLEALHGHTACALVVAYTGPADRAEEVVRPVREAGTVALDFAGPIPYPALNSMFDALHPPGDLNYWKADFVDELTDEVIAEHERYGADIPNPSSIMHIYPMNGAVQDVPSDATAFSYRDVSFINIIGGVDSDPAMVPARRDWARAYWSALHTHSVKGAYVNFLMDEGRERIQATYRDNFPRLREIKSRSDPDNIFRTNQNIPPKG